VVFSGAVPVAVTIVQIRKVSMKTSRKETTLFIASPSLCFYAWRFQTFD
jgi:hypothetical protein